MVYAAPPSSQLPQDGSSRPGHRRMRSHTVATDTIGPGAFAPVSSHLPRRKSHRKAFFLDDDESPSPGEEDPSAVTVVPSVLQSSSDAVPFPSSSNGPDSPGGPLSTRPGTGSPSFSRTPSTGSILLSNGKPLKSSLKSSASAPHFSDELRAHLRTKSEPSTPSVKSVHFREEDDLEDVKVYNRTGRPANLLLKPGEETETETEAESAFPFPRMHPIITTTTTTPTTTSASNELAFEIDSAPERTSVVPQNNPDMYANIHLETISLPKSRPVALRGSVLVRNVSFEKQVAVRFTFDDWQTTSEVQCKHVVSLPGLPPPFPRSRTLGDTAAQIAAAASSTGAPAWDRFSFQITLEDYADKLADRTLWLVARYTAPGHGEWWDNNSHANYRVQFRRAAAAAVAPAPVSPSSPVVCQQKSFVAPTTLRSTPQSGGFTLTSASPVITPAAAYAATVLGGTHLTASPRGSPSISPRVSPSGSPRLSPNGSPNSSDNERKARQRPKPTGASLLGLGAQPSPLPPHRAPGMTRSNSGPPVYSPSSGPQFFVPAPRETSTSSLDSALAGGATNPLMARLSKLALSNYARPAPPPPTASPPSPEHRKRSVSPEMSTIVGGHHATMDAPAVPDVKITEPSPPATEPTSGGKDARPSPSEPMAIPAAPASSAETSSVSSSPVAAASASTSGSSSPMPGTPLQLSSSDLSALVEHAPGSTVGHRPTWLPFKSPDNGAQGMIVRAASDSAANESAGPFGRRTTGDLILDMPTPLSRGAVNSPFSPVTTPRYSLDAALLDGGATATAVTADDHTRRRARVGTDDANYAAFIRQWCFARSPSPGSPASGVMGVSSASSSSPPAFGEATVRVEVGIPREGSTPRTSPGHSAQESPSGGATPVPFAPGRENAWLGLGERRAWEAGRA